MVVNCVLSNWVDDDLYVELKFHFTFAFRCYHNLSAQLFYYPHSLVCFIGASSLDNLVKAQEREPCYQRQVASYVTAIRGLLFNPNLRTKVKNLNFQLNSGKLNQLSNIVIWHDVVNNTVTLHSATRNSPLTTFQLIEHLGQHRDCVAALIYRRRSFTTCIEFELRQTGIQVINFKKHLLSTRRRVAFSQEIRQLHPFVPLEWAFFLTTRANSADLCNLVRKRGKRGRSKSKNSRRKTQQSDLALHC